MARPGGAPENLIPNSERTPIERKRIASNAGKKSAQVRKERKLLSQIYAEALSKDYMVEGVKYKGADFFQQVIATVLMRGDSSAVALMKEIAEKTEGNKLEISGPGGSQLFPDRIEIVLTDAKPND
jgi:hypothetical protein